MALSILPKNEHLAERILRVLVGFGTLSLLFVGRKSAWGLLGAIPLLTGVVGSCGFRGGDGHGPGCL